MKQLIYLGNKLEARGGAPTSIDILPGLLEKEGIQVISSSSKQNKILRLLAMQFTLLRNYKKSRLALIDTYSTQNFWYAVISAKLCRILKLPYILILHGGNLKFRLENNSKLSKKLFSNAQMNVVPSEYLHKIFEDNGFTNLIHIPNSIAVDLYPFKHRRMFEPKLLWLRSFTDIYNPKMAIEVLELVLQKYPEAKLCMVGPDKDGTLNSCKYYVREKNLPVEFTGRLKKSEWIELSVKYDIFLNTTNVDNTPVSVIEAKALGLPVISTDVGGLPFLIDNYKDGILIPPNDARKMAEAVQYIIENPTLSETLAKNARIKAESFNWDKVKHKWLQLIG